jgi:hypothetical protein
MSCLDLQANWHDHQPQYSAYTFMHALFLHATLALAISPLQEQQ